MSALGDYIHRSVKGYSLAGVSRVGQNPKQTRIAAYQAQKQKNLIRIKNLPEMGEELEALKTQIQTLYPQVDKAEVLKAQQKYLAEQNILDTLEKRILSSGIGRGNQGTQFKRTVATSLMGDKIIDEHNVKEIELSLRNIKERINLINNYSAQNKPVPKRTLTALDAQIKRLFKGIGFLPKDNISNINFATALGVTKVEELINIIKIELAFINASKATINGQFGERLVAMCDDKARGLAGKELNKAIERAIVGSNVSKFQISKDMIDEQVAAEMIKTNEIKDGYNIYQVRASQDKVDVNMTINGAPVNASVKAYTPKGNRIRAHLQDVRLLTSLLATEGEFGNHWLNLHSLKTSFGIADYDKVLEEHIKYEALVSGNLLKQNVSQADTFIAIDVESSPGRVFVASTKDILLNKTSASFYLRPELSLMNFHDINSEKFDTASQRIARILAQTHARKISVILNIPLKSK